MQTETRSDGYYFRFYRSECGYCAYTDWFGPFQTEERMFGAAWALYFYGIAEITKVYTDEKGTRLYRSEDAVYECFNEPVFVGEGSV